MARKGMDADEAVFSVEHSLDRTYLWSDKYRPRKPRYFNRVHTVSIETLKFSFKYIYMPFYSYYFELFIINTFFN